jgi:hypothetical protein
MTTVKEQLVERRLVPLVRAHSACYIVSQRRFDDLLAGAFINAAKTDLSVHSRIRCVVG